MKMRTPPDRYYPYSHEYIEDYHDYLAIITQGANGYWRMRDAYTTEHTNPTFFYFFYILVGKAAALFHLSSIAAYHLARFISLELFFLTLYLLTQRILGTVGGFWASVFAIVTTIAPVPLYQDARAFVEYTPWWSQLEALRRLDWMPHYIFGFSLVCACVLGIIEYIRKQTWHILLPLALTAFLLGFIFPPAPLPIFFCGTFALTVLYVRQFLLKKRTSAPSCKASAGVLLVILAAFASLLVLRHERYNGPPWSNWYILDLMWWKNSFVFDRELLLTFGALFALAVPAALYALHTGTFAYLFIVSWAFFPYVLVPWASTLGFGVYRLATVAHFIPLAILSSMTLHILIRSRLIRTILIVLFLSVSVPVSVSQAARAITTAQTFPLYINLYVPKSTWAAVQFLQGIVPKNARVLSDIFSGSMLPAYMPVVSYIGTTYLTIDYDQKKATVQRFFSNTMSNEEALDLLRSHAIDYVFFGVTEQQYGASTLRYPSLTPIYQNGGVLLYKVLRIQP